MRTNHNVRRTIGGWMLALSALAGGCQPASDSRAAVHGKVTLDGQPLARGAILFVPLAGTSGVVTGGPISDGHYDLPARTGAAIGANRVEITAMRKSGQTIPNPLGPAGSTLELEVPAIGPIFNTASTLQVEIRPGDNSADFPVTSD